MESQDYIDKMVWDYLDGILPENDAQEVERKISLELNWKSAFDAAMVIHNELKTVALEQPPPQFAAGVMRQIGKTRPKKENNVVIKAIALFFGICILSLIVNGLITDTASRPSILNSVLTVTDNYKNDHSVYLMMAVNLVLLLGLFDKFLIKRPPLHGA